jgi:hypothetical protein
MKIIIILLFFYLLHKCSQSPYQKIIKKWEPLLNYSSSLCPPIPQNEKMRVAIMLEKLEQHGDIDLIPFVRKNYRNITLGY